MSVGVDGPWGRGGAKKRELAETAPTLSSQHAQQHSMGDENLDRNNNLQKLHHVLVPFTESWLKSGLPAVRCLINCTNRESPHHKHWMSFWEVATIVTQNIYIYIVT